MKADEIWKQSLENIRQRVTEQAFETWFKPVRPGEFRDRTLTIQVPDKFFGDRLRENYYALIQQECARSVKDGGVQVAFAVEEGMGPGRVLPAEDIGKIERRRPNINWKYTFETFVVGSSNQFAHAACRKVAERPGEAYNPLYIYGGVGLGKTHLLNAVGNAILHQFPGKKISYISSEQFTNQLINSIRHDKMGEFRNRYRNVDTLLIDDIQFIAGKERTQEEFFHTFNALYETNKQMVISSDRSTKEMPEMEERLRSRFEMGLIADIQPPDMETKTAILRRKAEAEGIHIDEEVALFIASRINTNIRELEGSLIRLGAFSSLTGEPITAEFSKKVLGDTLDNRERRITAEEIQRAVAERFHLKVSELKSKKRTKTLVYPRQICMYLCRELTELSYPEIGRHFGGKDHSTVIHAVRHIEGQVGSDHQTKEYVADLTRRIKSR